MILCMNDVHPVLPAHLGDFLGSWEVSRIIDDKAADRTGRFRGRAVIFRSGETAVYDEAGTLDPGTGTAFEATRRYLWTEAPSGILIQFEDGRDFHGIILGGAAAQARHDCAPDLYLVTYDFAGWPNWSSVWTVSGPRKNYVMTTRYVRASE